MCLFNFMSIYIISSIAASLIIIVILWWLKKFSLELIIDRALLIVRQICFGCRVFYGIRFTGDPVKSSSFVKNFSATSFDIYNKKSTVDNNHKRSDSYNKKSASFNKNPTSNVMDMASYVAKSFYALVLCTANNQGTKKLTIKGKEFKNIPLFNVKKDAKTDGKISGIKAKILMTENLSWKKSDKSGTSYPEPKCFDLSRRSRYSKGMDTGLDKKDHDLDISNKKTPSVDTNTYIKTEENQISEKIKNWDSRHKVVTKKNKTRGKENDRRGGNCETWVLKKDHMAVNKTIDGNISNENCSDSGILGNYSSDYHNWDLAVPEATGAENLLFFTYLRGKPKKEIENYVKTFWVGLMDAKGDIQINHVKHNIMRYRFTIQLKNSDENKALFIWFCIYIKPSRIHVNKDDDVVQWYSDVERPEEIKPFLDIFDSYPPLTSGLICKLEFLKNCMSKEKKNAVNWYKANRNNKYDKRTEISSYMSETGTRNISYFPVWLSGFIEGKGSFHIKEKKQGFFSLQVTEDKYILDMIHNFFDITTKVKKINNKNVYTLKIFKRTTISAIVLHCMTYPLLGLNNKMINLSIISTIKELKSDKETVKL